MSPRSTLRDAANRSLPRPTHQLFCDSRRPPAVASGVRNGVKGPMSPADSAGLPGEVLESLPATTALSCARSRYELALPIRSVDFMPATPRWLTVSSGRPSSTDVRRQKAHTVRAMPSLRPTSAADGRGPRRRHRRRGAGRGTDPRRLRGAPDALAPADFHMRHDGQDWPARRPRAAPSAPRRSSDRSTCNRVTSPWPCSAKAATPRAVPTPTSSAMSRPGTRLATPPESSPVATSASTPATSVMTMVGSSRTHRTTPSAGPRSRSGVTA